MLTACLAFPDLAASNTVISQTRRFIASGGNSASNLSWVTWAETLTTDFPQRFGMPLSFNRMYPIRIQLVADEDDAKGRVVSTTHVEDQALKQHLFLINPSLVEGEEALYGLVELFIDRYLYSRLQQEDRLTFRGAAPGWLVTGLAGNLAPDLRRHMQEAVYQAVRDGRHIALEELLNQRPWNELSPMEEAASGLLVSWLLHLDRQGDLLRGVVADVAGQETGHGEKLVQQVTGVTDLSELQREYDLWVVWSDRVRLVPGRIHPHDVADLKYMLILRGARYEAMDIPGVPDVMTAYQLISKHDEPWAASVSMHMAMRMHALGLGRAPEFQDVAKAYATYFEAIHQAATMPRRWGMRSRVPSREDLRGYYHAAEDALYRLEEKLATPKTNEDESP